MRKRQRYGGPDKGWSWVVVLAVCFCSLVTSGVFWAARAWMVNFMDVFNVSLEEASWPIDLWIAVVSLTGPLAGFLGQQFGVRLVVMLGSLIGAIGMSSCFFATSLSAVNNLFGIVFGIGCGLVTTLMPVIVSSYFLNLRSTAYGISISGACFGFAIFPTFIEYLFDNYELSGCFVLTSGIILNIAVAGALMQPPSWLKQRMQTESIPLIEENTYVNKSEPLIPLDRKNSISLTFIGPQSPEKIEYEGDLDPASGPQRELQAELVRTLNRRTGHYSSEGNTLAEESYDSMDTSISSFYGRKSSALYRENDLLRAQKEFEDSISDFQSVVVDIEVTSKSDELLNRYDPSEVKTSDLTESCPARHSFSVSSAKRKQVEKFKSPLPSAGPLKKHNFFNSSGDIDAFDIYPVSENSKKEPRKISYSQSLSLSKTDEIPEGSEELVDDVFEDLPTFDKKTEPAGAVRSFVVVVISPMFYLTSLSNIIFFFQLHMFLSIIMLYSLDQSIQETDTKHILLCFVICDLLGKLSLGWITDRQYITRSSFTMIGMAGIGMIFFALPFATDYWSLLVVSGCYGVLLGCTMVMFPILLVDYLGTEIHAVSFGCMCFLTGIVFYIKPLFVRILSRCLGVSREHVFLPRRAVCCVFTFLVFGKVLLFEKFYKYRRKCKQESRRIIFEDESW
ncbi:monocarboxylate transporter 9 [Caerostris extrusa]|uniref:Monocarboxylate transporter 9 n=1 Tax=Caerostris extrusa TaxID=172846 RepID=A0AAV4U999_CAEEX|nr:monocarboxylate transporter 9 [Caerostris extrusa]